MFKNKVVLITGASQGIGQGLALAFAKHQAKIIVNYHKSKSKANKLTQTINQNHSQALAIKADVSKQKQVNVLIKKSLKQFKTIDILVNNACAIYQPTNWQKTSASNFNKTLAVNLTGVFNLIQAVAPIMLKQQSGKIINISSTAGILGRIQAPAYSAAKAGVINLTKAFAKELAPHINVNCIAPGPVKTGWHPPATIRKIQPLIPLKKLAKIKDVVNSTLFLASDQASHITGHTLILDGGFSLV